MCAHCKREGDQRSDYPRENIKAFLHRISIGAGRVKRDELKNQVQMPKQQKKSGC